MSACEFCGADHDAEDAAADARHEAASEIAALRARAEKAEAQADALAGHLRAALRAQSQWATDEERDRAWDEGRAALASYDSGRQMPGEGRP